MKREYGITIILLLAVLAACSAPPAMGACTCDVVTNSACACGTNGTVDGTVHVENKHFTGGDKTPDADFYVPGGTIKWARLYWTIWGGNPGETGWSNATFCNASNACWTNNRFINDSCAQTETDGWYKGGSGSHFLYWNVTDKVSTGKNSLNVDQTSGWSIDGRCYEIILVVVLDDGSSQTKYWINQGYDLPTGTEATWFNGIIDNTNHTLHHYAYGDNDAWTLKFNDATIESYSSGNYRPMETVEIDSSHISGSAQKMEWCGWEGKFHPNLAILVGNDDFFHPDLKVEDMKIERFNNSDQVPTEFVVCHTYDVDVLIQNCGGTDTSKIFNVSLYDNGTRVSNTTVNGLAHGASEWVTLQWHSTTSGNHTLRVMADSDNDVNDESIEGNNNETQYAEVLMNDTTSEDLYPEMRVLPAWRSNKTEIVVKMYNGGTTDASSFNVGATMTKGGAPDWANSSVSTSVYAKAYREITYTTTADLVNCSDYNVIVVLDTTGAITESNENNNATSKVFHAVDVSLKVTHHYGNTFTYNGVLSDNNDAAMIDVARVIPDCTTPYDLLGSEADIMGDRGIPEYVYGINKSANKGTSTWYLNESGTQDTTCPSGRPIYWYGFVNGIPMPGMPDPMDEYLFSEPGEVMRMDILKYVNSGSGTDSFRPRPIMDFPEPFLHGYGGTRWDTIIAYPNGYSAKADAIKTKLWSCGVSGVSTQNISATVLTLTQKQGNNLILLGTPTENSIIGDINAKHTEVGMPMYFDASNRLYDDQLYNGDDPDVPDCCSKQNSGYHGVIMACDNPFDNAVPWTNTWMDADKSVWIASGVTTCYAEDAADTLASGNLGDKGFWNKSRTLSNGNGGCGDVNGDGTVNWADYLTLRYTVVGVTGWTIKTSEWASDVKNCDCTVNWADYLTLRYTVVGVTGWTINCCDVCECDR